MSRQLTKEGRRACLWIGSAVLGVALLCGPDARADRPVRSLLEYRTEKLIRQQWDNSCAAASLASLLTFEFGYPVTERRVALGLLRQTDAEKVRNRGGFSLLDMKRYLQDLGFDGDGYAEMTIDDLDQMAPMIVPLHLHGTSHFVIVRSVSGRQIHIGDPAFGNYTMAHGAFLRRWSKSAFRIDTRTTPPPPLPSP